MYPWVRYMCMHLLQRDKHSQTPIRQLCVELPQTLLAAMCHQLLNASCPDSLHRSSGVFTSVGCHGGTSCHRALRLQTAIAMFTVFSSGPDTKSSYLNTNSGEAWSCKFQPKKSQLNRQCDKRLLSDFWVCNTRIHEADRPLDSSLHPAQKGVKSP